MNVLFLDDDKERTKTFRSLIPYATCVETASECIEQLRAKAWDVVFLDHDLGGEVFVSTNNPNTGSGVVRWIAEYKDVVVVKCFICHSLNPDGRKSMAERLAYLGYNTHQFPFAWVHAQDIIAEIKIWSSSR